MWIVDVKKNGKDAFKKRPNITSICITGDTLIGENTQGLKLDSQSKQLEEILSLLHQKKRGFFEREGVCVVRASWYIRMI